MIKGGTQPDPKLRRMFTPAGSAPAEKGSILSTFKGFGKNGWGRNEFLGAAERFNLISGEQRAAGGPVATAMQGVAETGERAAFAATAAGGASAGAAASSNPIYGGMYAQMLMRDHGFQVPAARRELLPDEAIGAVADDIADAAAPAVADAATVADAPVVAAADDVAAKVAQLEQQFVEGFQRLGALPTEQQIPTLAKALDAGAAAGHGDDAFGVLAATLASRPLEHSVPALHAAIDDAAKLAPAAETAAKATPVVDDVLAKAAPIVDDVVAKAAPVVDDVVTKAALPVADDALRHGLKGVMTFSAGIDDTLRLLAKLR